MIPEECASIRSIARCVLPVLVGPSTAVTPAPGARSCANVEGEKAIFCRCFLCRAILEVFHNATGGGRGLRSGTSLERNAPESLTLTETSFVHRNIQR